MFENSEIGIKKILIANRGEIACRVIKTAKKLGIKTVAIHSDVDKNAKFASLADETYSLGGLTSKESYLSIDKILQAIKSTGADAVHPGYGFLSENKNFVEILEKEGIIFIGPSSKSIDSMGDKIKAKTLAKEAGVSVVPGYVGTIDNAEEAIKIAKDLGYPIILKAVAGGGGKGMKIVHKPEDMAFAMESAKNEARNSFGDSRMFIEKFIVKPRHIEIQIIGDKKGNILCLGERECSIQRSNQKVIEEAPSPFLTQEVRKEMYRQSKMLAEKCGYHSAGTVEYIVDENRNFYFLEMNTRLQVEHPVTEYITGLDLVECMIRIADGQVINKTQNDIKLNGWAMECRICAEDPSKKFMPSIGVISHYKEPKQSYNVRVDSGVVEGSEISPFYDSMIAKLITFGDSRSETIKVMKKSLSEYEIENVSTNISFLESIIRKKNFIDGNLSTKFIETEYPDGFKGNQINNQINKRFVISVMVHHTLQQKMFYNHDQVSALPVDNNVISGLKSVVIDGECYNIKCIFSDDVNVEIDSQEYNYSFIFKIEEDVVSCLAYYSEDLRNIRIYYGSGRNYKELSNVDIAGVRLSYDAINCIYTLNSSAVERKVVVLEEGEFDLWKVINIDRKVKKKTKLNSPLTGSVVKILVKEEDKVIAGQALFVIEAMKMENIISAECDAKVKSILVKSGEIVSTNAVLVEYYNEN